MSELKIKVKYQHFEIEIEGDKDTVHNEFKDIKENGLGNLFGTVQAYPETTTVLEETLPSSSSYSKQIPIHNQDNNPSIKDVVMKQLPASETEWVLVYAYYVSEYGSKTFTTSDLLSMYEATKRANSSRKANLSNNIKRLFQHGNFSALNDIDYILTESGKESATEITLRTKGSVSKPVTKISKAETKQEKPQPAKSTALKANIVNNLQIVPDLNLRPKAGVSLIDYAKQYALKSYPEKILIIVYYLKEKLNIQKIGINHIFTALKELKEKIPPSLDKIINNTKSRNLWIRFEKHDDISLSIQGSNHVEHDLKKRSE